MSKFSIIAISILCAALPGCMSAQQHRANVSDDSGERVTVGTVQREIRVGMSGAEVITILGSPNIVTTDENRQETWVYDKISTETAYSTTSGGASILILGVGGSAGAASTSQQTLTIVIKFDRGSRVRDFAYHTSRF
jgi:outer membrane protein assembly factor BamE (lipoprotein component of BamABCDE complex)